MNWGKGFFRIWIVFTVLWFTVSIFATAPWQYYTQSKIHPAMRVKADTAFKGNKWWGNDAPPQNKMIFSQGKISQLSDAELDRLIREHSKGTLYVPEYKDIPKLSDLDIDYGKIETYLNVLLSNNHQDKAVALRGGEPKIFTDLRQDRYDNPILKVKDTHNVEHWAYVDMGGFRLKPYLISFLPPVMVLLIGLVVSWVFKGFRESD